jgi:uncharacterized protein DUF1153
MPVEPLFHADPLELAPGLPWRGQRWTVAREATVIQAVRGGWVPIEEVCALCNISPDEFVAWERDVDRYGAPGLRATRVQIDRTTQKGSERITMIKLWPGCCGHRARHWAARHRGGPPIVVASLMPAGYSGGGQWQ